MTYTRVLVACELRSYREALTAAFRILRPDVEVFEAEAEDVDAEIELLDPDLVVCTSLTPRVENCVPNWIELYPGYGASSTVSVRGERSEIEEIQLSDVLSALDEAVGADRTR